MKVALIMDMAVPVVLQAKEGDNTTSQPWSVQWETKAKWEAPGTTWDPCDSLCGIGPIGMVKVKFFSVSWCLKTTTIRIVDGIGN